MVNERTQPHTALPWAIEHVAEGVYVTSGDKFIALLSDEDCEIADAELICRSVNSHEALVSALKGLLALPLWVGVCDYEGCCDDNAAALATAALSQAQRR